MNVEHLHIITMNTDPMVRQSAMGFLYKYMMRPGIRSITVAHIGNSSWALQLLSRFTRHDDGIGWVADAKVHQDWLDGNVSHPASVDESRLSEIGVLAAKNAGTAQPHSRMHVNGAIVVVHGTSHDIDGQQPELVAKGFVRLTKKGDLPVFDKIVFNACRIGKTLTQATQLLAGNAAVYWDFSNRKGRKKNGSTAEVKASHVFTFNPEKGLEYETETAELLGKKLDQELVAKKEDVLVDQITIDQGFYNCIYRFLNVYGTGCNHKQIMVAGYDVPLTAAHPDKWGGVIDGAQLLENSGRKMLQDADDNYRPTAWVQGQHKVAYAFTRNGETSTLVELKQPGWSDR
ncbi:hypothetical protein [Jeongeupia chitinilytica]|uniref:Peptidase C80 domain-containing protein n=1 Tax=Jeongeupia chitinilytica TaxID=1041641 RepID=A0ABQ3H3D0_9NEIS|nr:hypothetical protein [Jeongeupia chitinilytica]GHD68265.1 hypothetical protein GCM10007350_33130 [Jeongeupia chitinilytica]